MSESVLDYQSAFIACLLGFYSHAWEEVGMLHAVHQNVFPTWLDPMSKSEVRGLE